MSPQIVLTSFAFSKNWTARIALASQHFGKISDKMEQCLRQKIAGVDEQFCHVVNEIEDGKCDLSRMLHLQVTCETLLINVRTVTVRFRSTYFSSTFMDAPNTICSFSQQCRCGDNIARRRNADARLARRSP